MSALADTLSHPSTGRSVTGAAFRIAWRAVPYLPARIVYAAADVVARATFRANGPGVRQLRRNIGRLRPDLQGRRLQTVTRDGVRSYMRYWVDLFRLPSMTREQVLESVRVEGDHLLRNALNDAAHRGVGVTAFLGHMGNWDHAGAWCQLDLAQVVSVAERLEPTDVFDAFVAAREALGMRVHGLTGGGDLVRVLRDELHTPGVLVPLLADRDLTGGGVEVDFPGGAVSMAVGPAALAIGADTALVPVTMYYERARGLTPSGYRSVLVIHPAVPAPPGRTRERVRAMTQSCADVIAEGAAAHPEDWHMMQPFWVDDVRRSRRPG